MPNFDKQGPPDGGGPMTGGQRGVCDDADKGGRPFDGRGKGRGRGRGRGRGLGRGRFFPEEEKKDEGKSIEARLNDIRKQS